jgi:5-deoxy-glucuronate isomerase
MSRHIPPYDNQNRAIVDRDDATTPLCYFNHVRLKKGERFVHNVAGYETLLMPTVGTCDVQVGEHHFATIGKREHLWGGDPEAVYVPVGASAEITCVSDRLDLLIGGGRYDEVLQPFAVRQDDVDKIQYGSDDTKTHRKIKHILGQKNASLRGRLLVSELFTVGAGGWSGFPPHKHDTERVTDGAAHETEYQEVYQFRFNPDHGFGAQFVYEHEDDHGPVYHVRSGSVVAIDKGYHPSVAAPGYEMYYFTVIVGARSKSLVQHFDPHHAYQVETIPGIKNMIAKFK